MDLADASGRRHVDISRLCKFDFDVVNCAGIYHQAADVLSSIYTTRAHTELIKDDLASHSE